MRIGRCDRNGVGCGGPIVWARTDKNKAMPFNVDEGPEGWVLVDIPGGSAPRALYVGHRVPHHATCPKVDEFRKATT